MPSDSNLLLLLLLFSSDLWVPGISCSEKECPYNRFDPSQSSTFSMVNDTPPSFYIAYGIGSVNGTFAKDDVHLGDAFISQQMFGIASSTKDLILMFSSPSNGILGLGYPALTASNVEYDPFLFRLQKEGLIERPVFSISMGSVHDHGWVGEILLGGTNPEKYIGEINYEPVWGNHTYWMVGGRSVQIIKKSTVPNEDQLLMNSTFISTRGLIIDTGTTLTYMDRTLTDEIVHMVTDNVIFDHMSGTYMIDCALKQETATDYLLKFTMERTTLAIPIKDLILPLMREGKQQQDSSSICMFGIAPWMTTGTSKKMNENGWILIGDSVLRSTYLVFDMKDHQIGFAEVRKKSSLFKHLLIFLFQAFQYVNKEAPSSLGNRAPSPIMSVHQLSVILGIIALVIIIFC